MKIRTAVILGLVPVAAMLFAGHRLATSALDEDAYRLAGEHIAELRHLDASINLRLLRLRFGAVKADDVVVEEQVAAVQAAFHDATRTLDAAHRGKPPQIVAALAEYDQLERRRLALLPEFTRLNEARHKAGWELPRVVVFLEKEADSVEGGADVAAAVRRLERAMNGFHRTPSDERIRNLTDATKVLVAAAEQHTPELVEPVAALVAYARRVAEERPLLDACVDELLALPTDRSLQNVADAHRYRYEELAARAAGDGWLLLMACCLLLIHVVVTLTRLYRTRRLAEEANVQLAREQAFVNNVLSTMTDALLVLRPDGTVRFVNTAAERLIEAPLDHIEGISIAHLLASGNAARVAEDVRDGQTFRDRVTGVEKCTGEIVPVSLSSAALRDEHDEFEGFVVIAHDLRSIRAMHERQLSDQARAREAELRARELKMERDEAAFASQAKAEFLAHMSHEIRTPLNGVIGLTDLLLETKLDQDQRQYARTIGSCGTALLTLINDVLDLSKIEAGKLDIEEVEFDLHATVEDTAWAQAPRAFEKGVEPVVLLRPDVPARVRGDVTRYRQVVTNLLGNAIKFTERGEVVVELSVVSCSGDEVVIETAVRDSGIGIEKHKQKEIFREFTQADGSTTRRFGGTGLGLAISERLVEAMGGEIWVESEFGSGSTFRFTTRFGALPPSGAEPALPEAQGKDLRVLCMDRSEAVLEALSVQLGGFGFRVDTARDAREALRKLDPYTEAGPLDLFVLSREGLEHEDIDGLFRTASVEGVRIMLLEPHGTSNPWESRSAPRLLKPVARSALVQRLREALGWAPPTSEVPQVSQISRPITPRGRFLVAEDNPVNQMVTRKMLESLGCRVDVVTNGAEAVAAVQATPYSAVFMDCQMPVLDGFEATRQIRALAGAVGGIPIVALTANALKGDRERCLEAGMTAYVRKPVRHADFDHALRELESASSSEAVTDEVVAADPALPAESAEPSIYDTLNDGSLLQLQALDVAGEEGIVPEIVQLFLESTREILADVGSAVDESDFTQLRAAAHRLKGSSLNIGGMRLGNLAAAVEQAARDRDAAATARLACHLVPEFERLEARLRSRGFATVGAPGRD